MIVQAAHQMDGDLVSGQDLEQVEGKSTVDRFGVRVTEIVAAE